jgi:hypothetical protein
MSKEFISNWKEISILYAKEVFASGVGVGTV